MPFILPFVPLILAGAGAGASVYAQSQASKATTAAANYNNKLAGQAAHNQELQAVEGIKRQRINNRAALGQIRLEMANSGTQTGEGSPLAVLGETAGRMEVGIADAARNSALQAASARAQGKMGLWEADQSAKSAQLQMAATAISAAGSIASGYQSGSNLGLYTRTKTQL